MTSTNSDPWAMEVAKTNPGFEIALHAALTYRGNARARVDRLLDLEPASVFGHCLRAALLVRAGAPARSTALESSLKALGDMPLASGSLPLRHAAAARIWLAGDPAQAQAAYGAILTAYPRDLLALMAVHALDFQLGQRTQMLARVASAIGHWQPAMAGYPSVLAIHAFALEENGHYRKAEQQARQALALEPGLPAAIHSLAHVMEMEGRAEEGLALLSATEPHWIAGTGFSVHLAWHRALFHLEMDDRQTAIAVYDREIMKIGHMDQAALGDAASLLWRLQLLDFNLGNRWQQLADRWEEFMPLGARPFFAPHAMMAFVSAGRMTAAHRLLRELAQTYATGTTATSPEHELAVPLCRAFGDFVREDYAACIARLVRLRKISHRCGGSLAQCDMIHLTLTEAALRAQTDGLARMLVAERSTWKPYSPTNHMLQRRLNRPKPANPQLRAFATT